MWWIIGAERGLLRLLTKSGSRTSMKSVSCRSPGSRPFATMIEGVRRDHHISSIQRTLPLYDSLAYAAAKAALTNYSKGLSTK